MKPDKGLVLGLNVGLYHLCLAVARDSGLTFFFEIQSGRLQDLF